MNVLKIIFYGLLAFIERHPIFCTIIVLLAVFAPMVFKVVGWIILGIIALLLILFGFLAWKLYKMKREMKKRFEQGMGGANFGGASFGNGQGFGGFYTGGMSLEELVRQMQAQAEAQQRAQQQRSNTSSTTTSGSAQKRVNDKVGDYVDFEEVE